MLGGACSLIKKKEDPTKTLHLDSKTVQLINLLQIQQHSFGGLMIVKEL